MLEVPFIDQILIETTVFMKICTETCLYKVGICLQLSHCISASEIEGMESLDPREWSSTRWAC